AVELSRIRLDVLSAMQDYRATRVNRATAEASLRSLTGLTDWQLPVKAEWDLTTPLPSALVPLSDALIIAERERPDLEAMRWQINKTGADIVVAQRAARPTIQPSLGWTRQYQQEIDQPNANSWDANVTMSVPVFDRNQGNICKAQAAERQAQHLYNAHV